MSSGPRMTTKTTLRMPSQPAAAIGHGAWSRYRALSVAVDPIHGRLTRARMTARSPLRPTSTGSRDALRHAAHKGDMPVGLHHVVIDAHDLPGLARFWTRALGWKVLSERENEIVIGTDENAPLGICFMPVTDPKTVKNRVPTRVNRPAREKAVAAL